MSTLPPPPAAAAAAGGAKAAEEKEKAAAKGKLRVLVVGGGVAGLACALKLREERKEDVEVVLLEARDRLGGRILTRKLVDPKTKEEIPIDLGASWIHDISSEVGKRAKEFGLELSKPTAHASRYYFSETGKPLSAELVRDGLRLVGMIDRPLYNMARSFNSYVKSVSIREKYNELLKELSDEKEAFKKKHKLSEKEVVGFLEMLNQGTESYFAAKFEEMSLGGLDDPDEEHPLGGDFFVLNGYTTLINALREKCKADIRLQHVVESVSYHPQGVVVRTNKGAFEGDFAVVTAPLGVLKTGAIKFDPPLPAEKKQVIENLGMGTVNKLVMHFSHVFWQKNACWMQFACPKKEFNQYFVASIHMKHAVIMGWTNQDFARSLEEEKDDQKVLERALKRLAQAYGEKTVKEAFLGGFISRWSTDPYARGSYAFLKVGTSGKDFKQLAQPVAAVAAPASSSSKAKYTSTTLWNGRLRFCGEATEASAPGTVHGAYRSGAREARAILSIMDQDKKG